MLGDWDFNLRMLEQYEIGVLKTPLAYYHHRVKDKTADSTYANSIIGGIDRHQFYHAYLKNELLRRDMQRKTLGIGLLVNLCPQIEFLLAFANRAEKLARPFLKIAGGTKRGYQKVSRIWTRR